MNVAPANPGVSEEPPAIVYFDGVCGICNWSVDFILLRDRKRRFRFAPLQGATSAERIRVPPDELLKSIVYEDQAGLFRKSDAVWRILVRLGGIWGVLGRLLWCVPRPLRNWGYDVIARNRYSLFGRKEACRIPTKEERSLFLP